MSSGTMNVDEPIGRFRPFQGDERPVKGVESDKPADEFLTFLFQYTYGDFDAGIPHLPDASA